MTQNAEVIIRTQLGAVARKDKDKMHREKNTVSQVRIITTNLKQWIKTKKTDISVNNSPTYCPYCGKKSIQRVNLIFG